MNHEQIGTTEPGGGGFYEIRIEGGLDERWDDYFSDLSVSPVSSGQTLLTGRLPDQAALHGVLKKLRDLGLVLIYVRQIDGAR